MGFFLKRSITLVELLVSVALIGLLVTGISSLSTYAQFHVITSDRRAQLQNELSFVLEDMSKSIFGATGDVNNPGILNVSGGFRVRIDVSGTPDDYSDDSIIDYTIAGNRIRKEIDGAGPVDLNTRDIILPGGFNYTVLDNGTGIEIFLIARHDITQGFSLDNPELRMQVRVYSRSASRN